MMLMADRNAITPHSKNIPKQLKEIRLRYTLIPGNGEIHQILKDDVSVADERLALTQRLSFPTGDAFNFFYSAVRLLNVDSSLEIVLSVVC